MSYTATIKGDKEFFTALKRASEQTFKEVHNEGVSIVQEIRNNIIRGMQNTKKDLSKGKPRRYVTINRETGRRKSIRSGKAAKFHYPSFPGNYPAIDSGELVGSMMTDVREHEMEVGSVGVPHAEFTDKGTPKMKARPWLKPSFEKIPIQERLWKAFQRGADKK